MCSLSNDQVLIELWAQLDSFDLEFIKLALSNHSPVAKAAQAVDHAARNPEAAARILNDRFLFQNMKRSNAQEIVSPLLYYSLSIFNEFREADIQAPRLCASLALQANKLAQELQSKEQPHTLLNDAIPLSISITRHQTKQGSHYQFKADPQKHSLSLEGSFTDESG